MVPEGMYPVMGIPGRRSGKRAGAPPYGPQVRAIRICDRNGCYRPAELRCGIEVYPPEEFPGSDEPAIGVTGLAVCQLHASDVKLSDVLTDEGWKLICDQFHKIGMVEPDKGRTKLRLLPYQRLQGQEA